jgi:hypothetical protein
MTTAQLKSLQDLRDYTQSLAGKRPEDDPRIQKLRLAKQATWLFLLTCTFLFYYLIEKMIEALAML